MFRPSGLKSQHFTSIAWLAKATAADVKGLEVGSKTLEFRPSRGPGDLWERNITINSESPAASAVLVFQAVYPFLLFAGNESGEPVELTISGGTNVSFSPSYEYLDQVLLPTLEVWFGVQVERRLNARGWSLGPASRGSLWFRTQPVPFGDTLRLNDGLRGLGSQPGDLYVKNIDVTIIAPSNIHAELEAALRERLGRTFPGVECDFRAPEESRHEARIYVLLVARATTLRWGRDVLYSGKRKGKTSAQLSEEVVRTVVKSLAEEIGAGGAVDEFLQDQLVIFQALAQGRTSFPRCGPENEGENSRAIQESTSIENELERLHLGVLRKDRTGKPFGDMETDSTHTQTARWVAAKVLEPKVTWYNNGKICEGIGLPSGISQ